MSTQKDDLYDNQRVREYVSSRGVKATFRPMNPMLKERIEAGLQKQSPKPTPPTRPAKVFGGGVEHIELTDESEKTPEQQQAWDTYQEALAAWEGEFNKRMFRASVLRCMDVEMPGDEWFQDQQALGIDVPDTPQDRKFHFVETEFVGDTRDVVAIIQIPIALTVEPSAAQDAAARLFRRLLEGFAAYIRNQGEAWEGGLGAGLEAGGDEPDTDAGAGEVGDTAE